jgi:outer membrane cobalamin receptor
MEEKNSMQKGCLILLAVTLVLTAAPRLWAVQAADGIYRLGEVVVTGEGPSVEAVGTTHTVTAQDIEQRGVRTLDEAINLLPGIDVRVGGDGTPRIDMRGFRTRHVKLLLNGTPYNSTYDGQFDPANIPVENIAEIKVTTGAGSTLYGPGGNGGVINIITKAGTSGLHGSLNGELMEGDAHLLRGTASYGAENYDVFVSASSYERDYFPLSDHFSLTKYQDSTERENSDRRLHNAFASITYSPTDATSVGVTIDYLNGERGKPSYVNYDKKDEFAKKLKYDREDDSEGFNAQVAFSHDFNGPVSLKGWAFFNSLDIVENRYDDGDYDSQEAKGAYHYDSTTEITGVNLQARYDMARLGAATLGLMMENDDYEADGFEIDKKLKKVETEVDEDFQLYTVSLEYEVSPVRDLDVVLGFGYHYQDRSEKSEEDYSYLIGASYQLFEGTRLKVSHSRKVRFPTLRDLYEPGLVYNPDLGAETTWHYEAGIEQALPAATTLSLTGFYIDIEDFIEKTTVVINGEEEDIRKNFEEYEFKGVEVLVENRYFEKLFLRAGYTWLDTEDQSSDSNRDEVQYNPEHKLTLEATYQLPWGVSVYGSAMYVAKAYFYGGDDNELKKRLPEYVICDFKINKRTAGGALDLYFGINNVFDEDYEQSYLLPQPGRTLYGGATWRF